MKGWMEGCRATREGERCRQRDFLPAPRVHLSGTEGSTVAAPPFPPAQHFETRYNNLPTQPSVVVVVVVVYRLYLHHPGLGNDPRMVCMSVSGYVPVKFFSTSGPWTGTGP